jgi:hypothetical protein
MTRIRHLPQVPAPPHGVSITSPARAAASKIVVPRKTDTDRPCGWNVTRI